MSVTSKMGFILLCAALVVFGGGSARATPPPVPIGPGANFDRQAYVEGLRDAPGLLAKAGVACTVNQAVYEGDSSLLDAAGKTVGHARLYEVACAEGLGYLLTVKGKSPVAVFDCIQAGQTGKIACMLPLNSHPAGGLDPSLKAAGVDCGAERARRIGADNETKLRRYEVSCGALGGYVLDIPLADGSGPAPRAVPCIEDEQDCRMTSHVQNVVALASRLGRRFGDDCRIADARYVGYVAARGNQLYEVSCQAGHDGELIEVDPFGALKSRRECSKIKLVGAACLLKAGDVLDPKVAIAEQEAAASRAPGFKLSVITNPDWISKPSGKDFETYFPIVAQRGRVNGRAVIGCEVTETGTLDACSVIDESPVGFGFGAAALKMSAAFRMRPQTRDGRPISGARVQIPINFVMNR